MGCRTARSKPASGRVLSRTSSMQDEAANETRFSSMSTKPQMRGPKVLGEAKKVPHPKGGDMDFLMYAPRSGETIGIVVVAPGSTGGFGPSIESRHRGLPLSKQGSLASRGSLYARLGLELSTGMEFDWGNRQVGQGAGGGAVDTEEQHIVVLQITWRFSEDGVKWPAGRLGHLESLAASSGDVCVIIEWAINR